ncbi:glyoxalase family protein [Rhizodiscina lignyota]|uniref:Glyoxalase family protein n=1 Tax=Rhizodiscina lignyota TaxID=1504668 RepID=A0A9P4M9R4_9PEZI|nr:glyoxalase family protein [Rhizodiscina lignyota]
MAGPNKINLQRLSYVIYEHPDMESFERFAEDFGFESVGKAGGRDVFFRGYGPDPFVYVARLSPNGSPKRFYGAGFVARTAQDFDRACQMQGAEVKDVSHRPGSGKMVSVPDPNGFVIEIVYGQEEKIVPRQGISVVEGGRPIVNGAVQKSRKGVFNRMSSNPAKVHKIGHFGYMTDNYKDTCAWYGGHFNLKASDIVHRPGDESAELMCFFHLDLGAEYSDHHCLLVAGHHGNGSGTRIHHSSFEVEDLDTQMMGHQWLAEKGYKPMWGVGRHVMGSQIFDYWYDTTGFIIEHYADGDVVNQDTPTCRSAGTPAAIWGPPLPVKWD